MAKWIELTGKTFGRLQVVSFSHVGNNYQRVWNCKCECGNNTFVIAAHLLSGKTKSCGCYQAELRKRGAVKHGEGGTKHETSEHRSYRGMIQRCTNPNDSNYFKYGMRGIAVCDRWLHSYENFLSDMGRKPSSEHSIERINNNLNYEPANCRWATRKEQCANRRSNTWIEYGGKRMILQDWSRELGDVSLYQKLKTRSLAEIIEGGSI